MKLKRTHSLCIALLFSIVTYGQLDSYQYKQEIEGVSDLWHSLELPPSIFKHLTNDFRDIRVFGITPNDTIEAPFVIQSKKEEVFNTEVIFKRINESHTSEGYYYTFEVTSEQSINRIHLNFEEDNFDWNVTLEASSNNKDWFTLTKDYRILAIKNSQTDYRYTNLTFPEAKYQYYRLLVPSNKKPKLSSASLNLYNSKKAKYYNYTSLVIDTKTDKKSKETIVDITLEEPVSISSLKINVKDTFNYYRPIHIQYLLDSIKTEKGWKYNYQFLNAGTLNSIEKNEFKFNSTTVQKLKVTIKNYDNQPLHLSTFEVKGYTHELIARFNEPAAYYLAYGKKNGSWPNYDISRFSDKIPDTLKPLQLLDKQSIEQEEITKKEALFTNKLWLWIIMGLIIIVLAWYSFKMMKKV